MLLLAALSHACDGPYSRAELATDLGRAQSAMRAMEDAPFGEAAHTIRDRLACLDTVFPAGTSASVYRTVGAAAWLVDGNQEEARRWFRGAREVDPRYDWDAGELPLNHPMRAAWDELRAAPAVVPTLADPPILGEGAWTLDGRNLSRPAATPDRPHLLQREMGGTVRTWRLDGSAFPADALMVPEVVAQPTPEPVADRGFQTVQVQRERPPAQVPLLLAGAVGLVAAGGAYGASFGARSSFDTATTTEGVESAAGLTNALVIAAGGLAAGGVGVAVIGFSL